ncbi:hypothetical protein H4582DRAFT_2203463 [Lactarius indigo]|nr:hypothetical protein H4582DRAFT_2203463 [Lactarius indigo]
MSYTVAANIRLAGSAQGTFIDDLTSPGVGQWPKTQAIRKITNVVVYTWRLLSIPSGSLMMWRTAVSSLRLPCNTVATGGIPSLTFAVGGNILFFGVESDEKLIAVYGSRLVNSSPYGDRNIVQLVIRGCKHRRDRPKRFKSILLRESTVPESEKFELAWPITAASSVYVPTRWYAGCLLASLGILQRFGQGCPRLCFDGITLGN